MPFIEVVFIKVQIRHLNQIPLLLFVVFLLVKKNSIYCGEVCEIKNVSINILSTPLLIFVHDIDCFNFYKNLKTHISETFILLDDHLWQKEENVRCLLVKVLFDYQKLFQFYQF